MMGVICTLSTVHVWTKDYSLRSLKTVYMHKEIYANTTHVGSHVVYMTHIGLFLDRFFMSEIRELCSPVSL